MIGYLMIWVIVAIFFVIFLMLFTITLIRVGIQRLRERRQATAGGKPDGG